MKWNNVLLPEMHQMKTTGFRKVKEVGDLILPIYVLIRPQSIDITVRIILAHDKRIPAQTLDLRAPDAGGAAPHHLRVMRAVPVRHARVRPVVVVRRLVLPRLHRLGGRPLVPLPPEYVLPVVAAGVDHRAVAPPLVRPPPGVAG